MGVHRLWDLVASAGRRVHPDTLEGRVAAVDASIWLAQCIYAMRDRDGNLVRGAHLRGFFSRILKLLYYRIKPVFVFDGIPPERKRATLLQRRQLKEKQNHNLRKTAEKLLVATMKQRTVRKLREHNTNTATNTRTNTGAHTT
eukprot:Lankesteria_metandrocarpae@DN10632_c0_g1_i1.p1